MLGQQQHMRGAEGGSMFAPRASALVSVGAGGAVIVAVLAAVNALVVVVVVVVVVSN